MTLQVGFFIRPFKSKQRKAENDRSWLSTCSQVIKPWLLKLCVYVQNCCHLCLKSGLNFTKRWLFTSVRRKRVIVGLKLLTTGIKVTTVLYAQGKNLNLV